MKTRIALPGAMLTVASLLLAGLLPLTGAQAQNTDVQSAKPATALAKPTPDDGEAIYTSICQGCHMPDAKGAKGAGTYPALAANHNLETAGYPITVVLQGQKAMPSFGPYLSDEQVAAVVNYVRSHFSNSYTDKVTVADVKIARPAAPH
ncbi:c-type cytochrome [Oleisolibacter albus]|uniref:c-type cytochrome n=1 Tax=Oleisolibacter albus TaxID=2171757 RepID=UPI001EFEE512|nr:cytochrome c [Oleisolibacter albus]